MTLPIILCLYGLSIFAYALVMYDLVDSNRKQRKEIQNLCRFIHGSVLTKGSLKEKVYNCEIDIKNMEKDHEKLKAIVAEHVDDYYGD